MSPNGLAKIGRRICVVGTSGSGKTAVVQAVADALGLVYVCNDAVIWRANWQSTPRGEVYAELEAATRDVGWTFDGNLGPTQTVRASDYARGVRSTNGLRRPASAQQRIESG